MTRQEEITLARVLDMQYKLDSFEEAVLVDLEKVYKTASDNLLKDVQAAKGKSARLWTNTRLIKMLEEVQVTHKAIVNNLSDKASSYIGSAGSFAYRTMNNIGSWDGRMPGWKDVSLSVQQIKQLVTEQKLKGKTLSEWIGTALSPNIDEIKSGIQTGYVRGQGFAKVVSRLQNELALPKGSKDARDLESVVKTYTQSVSVKAQQDIYEANADIVTKIEWTAILEGGNVKTGRGTCPRCIALDGQQWETKDYNRPPCPLHVRCRCLLLPVTKTWRELGFDIDEMERAYSPWFIKDEKGRKIEKGRTDMGYHDWFMSRDKAFQDKAVGPRRAALIRQGNLELTDLVDKKGNLVLLNELVPRFAPKTRAKAGSFVYGSIPAVGEALSYEEFTKIRKPKGGDPEDWVQYNEAVERLSPEDYRRYKSDILNSMEIQGLTPDKFTLLQMGTDHIPANMMESLALNGVNIKYGSKNKYLNGTIQLKNGAFEDDIAHEFAHAIDDMYAKGRNRFGYWKSDISYPDYPMLFTEEDSKKYKEEYFSLISGKRTAMSRVFGEKVYTKHELINEYEAIKYTDEETAFGEEFFAINVERYFRATRIGSKEQKEVWEEAKSKYPWTAAFIESKFGGRIVRRD